MDTFFLILSVVGMVVGVYIIAGLFSDMMYKFSEAKQRRLEEVHLGEVNCDTCGVRLLKDYASVVKDYRVSFYCQAHKKPYDEISSGNFYKRMRVDSEGEPIGYMKKMDIKPDNFTQFTYTYEGGGNLKDKSKEMPKGKCK